MALVFNNYKELHKFFKKWLLTAMNLELNTINYIIKTMTSWIETTF